MLKKIIVTVLLIVSFIQAQDLRVSVHALQKKYDQYKIIDARDLDLYKQGHLKNAISFPDKLTYENLSKNGKLAVPQKLQKVIRDRGLDKNDKIVIYDQDNFYNASRVFWTLEVYGFKNVKLLSEGYKAWVKNGYPVTKVAPNITKSDYIATIDNSKLATKLNMQIAIKNPSYLILDARKPKDYIGKTSTAKRYGHIPKSINVPALYNLDNSNDILKLKNTAEIEHIYGNMDKSKKIVAYCSIGKAAATNYFALRELGYRVALYDASWNEWGNDDKLPVVNPSKK